MDMEMKTMAQVLFMKVLIITNGDMFLKYGLRWSIRLINTELADIFGNRTDLTYVAQGYDEVDQRYFRYST